MPSLSLSTGFPQSTYIGFPLQLWNAGWIWKTLCGLYQEEGTEWYNTTSKKKLGNNRGTICHQFSFHEWRPFRTVCHCDKGGIWLSTTLTSGNRYPVWLNCIIHIDFQSGPFQSLLMQLWWLLVELFLHLGISLYFLLFSGIKHSLIGDLSTSRESPFHYKFVYSFACP